MRGGRPSAMLRLRSALVGLAVCVGVADAGLLVLHSAPGTPAVAATPAREVAAPPLGAIVPSLAPDVTATPAVTSAPAVAGAPAAPAAPDHWGVGHAGAHFVDASRAAPARLGGGPGRPLDTVISFPTTGTTVAAGRFPLVVFVHGFAVTPSVYAALTDAWARAGYVVASPAFPGEVGGLPGATQDDLANEPADVRFVISSMLGGADPVRAAIDPARIAVAGHSDGGEVAAAVGLDRCCADPRVGATIVMSGAELGAPGGGYAGVAHGPALIVQADSDAVNDPANAVRLYSDTPGQAWYLNLRGGSHLDPFLGTDPRWAIVPRVTVDFLDFALKRGAPGIPRFERDAIVPGVAQLYLKN